MIAAFTVTAAAQAPTETTVIARTATGRGTYHYAEIYQQRGAWIVPDVGYIDFNRATDYREIFIGGGRLLVHTGRLTVVGEGFLDAADGRSSGGAVYLLPWTLGAYRFAENIRSEVVYFPYLPLNDAGRVQHVLERAKVEWDFTRVTLGGGYAAYRFADDPWQQKPFVAATLKAGDLGSVEFWLQRLSHNNVTVQVRYTNLFK